ncbi:hypothetical protein [uncultured Dokdonia sp.]|uniref:hypothetical protein n=1 Tax=uncultured Dokdonia sp. TaxID=575653 RepID=UPI002634A590|nr:hypothetical protein [uncultured Dokdonia sp.]
MKKVKKLSLKKLTISKLTNSDRIQGGSGICDGGGDDGSRPFNDCPPPQTCLRTDCKSCIDQNQTAVAC